MIRRRFLKSALALAAMAASSRALAGEEPKELRIGYQKTAELLVAKQNRLIETRLAPLGAAVKWVEFPFGPPLTEALGAGALDYGFTGDAPPIFAQAANVNLVYVAVAKIKGSNSGILVAQDSPIKQLADLKGKRLGFTKGSSAHNLTIAALEKAGLSYSDVIPVYLTPADGAAAFVRRAIDVWTIWDPFFAIAERAPGVRILALSEDILPVNSFLLANRDYVAKYPDIVGAANDEVAKADVWAMNHKDEAAALFAGATGVDIEAEKLSIARSGFALATVSDDVVEQQQAVADRFFKLGLIPKPVRVRDIVWRWTPGA